MKCLKIRNELNISAETIPKRYHCRTWVVKKNTWAVKLTAIIAGAHLIVLTVVSFGYVKVGQVAIESLYAVTFRVIVWMCIILLIPRRNKQHQFP